MFAEFRFQLGRLMPTSSFSTSWCDDRVVVERIMETAKTGLLQSNAQACQTANCSLLTAQCHREISSNKRFYCFTWYTASRASLSAHRIDDDIFAQLIIAHSFHFELSQFWGCAQLGLDRSGQLSTVQLRRLFLRRFRSSWRRNVNWKDQSNSILIW